MCRKRIIITHHVSQSKHDPMLLTRIRHPRMPKPQVPNHDIPPLHLGLHRRSRPFPRRQRLLRDPRNAVPRAVHLERDGRRLGEHLLVLVRGVDVRAQPELGRAVGDGEVAEGDVGDEVVGVFGVVKGRVLVHSLAEARGVGDGGVGRQPVPHRGFAKVSGDGPIPLLSVSLLSIYIYEYNSEICQVRLTHWQLGEGRS